MTYGEMIYGEVPWAGEDATGSSGIAALSLSANGSATGGGGATATLSLLAVGGGAGGGSAPAALDLTASGDIVGSATRSGTASLSLLADGSVGFGTSASGDLSLVGAVAAGGVIAGSAILAVSASGGVGYGTSGNGVLTLGGSGSVSGRASGTAALTLVATHATIIVQTVTVQGAGQIVLVSENLVFSAELGLSIIDPIIERVPSTITVVLSGGVAQTDVTFDIDGVDLYTTNTDSAGMLGPTSLEVSSSLGAGTHTVTATQGSISDSATFTVLRAASPYPTVPGLDAPPVDVPEAVRLEGSLAIRHWVLQDLAPGGLGNYVFPHNPRTMTSPHREHALSSRHSTAGDGKPHVFQSGNLPKEWTLTGYCPSEAQQRSIEAYREINRRFYIIDHRNRAWKVICTNAQFVPRLRQTYNGVVTDWGSDYTITLTVVDQTPQTPEVP